ncbi:Band 3 anion transport protein [Armadillidium nasatum]|uniref:Band 3 anion transport protein n=1 Tax=Armadillidium nasatum TaxID=96803 RepID=A0A5N5SQ88_9CRUS|nr:Band 3 anion transport protein [Armadillidium nasatum]
MCLIGYFINGVYLDRLRMPVGIQPSNSKIRGWLISPFGVIGEVPVWAMFAAGPASLLLFILIFLEENICHLILSSPERNLKKGTGFHLDLVLSCAINTLSGFLGAPFMSPACVRTISHMSALTVFSDKVAPGEPPKIVGCLEQRISNLTVSVLIGLSVLLYFILNLVPNAVLLGVFLYMGVSATAGIQLLDRTFLYLLPVKYHPNVPYAKDAVLFSGSNT